MTDFVEGHEPMSVPAGTCYYMLPPNTPMAAANLGTEDVHLYDTFNLPPDAPTITVIEPGVVGYELRRCRAEAAPVLIAISPYLLEHFHCSIVRVTWGPGLWGYFAESLSDPRMSARL